MRQLFSAVVGCRRRLRTNVPKYYAALTTERANFSATSLRTLSPASS